MTERRNPFEGVTDFFSELARMRSIGLHGGAEHGVEASERTHASAWVPATDILARRRRPGDPRRAGRRRPRGRRPQLQPRRAHGVRHPADRRPTTSRAEFLIRERFYGEFRRAITLPEGTEADQISAEFDDGLVEITVTNGVSPADSTKISLADKSEAPTTRERAPATDVVQASAASRKPRLPVVESAAWAWRAETR